MMNGNIILEL